MAHVMLVAAIELTSLGFATGTTMAPPRGSDWVWVWIITIFAGALGHLMLAWSHHHVEAWLGGAHHAVPAGGRLGGGVDRPRRVAHRR